MINKVGDCYSLFTLAISSLINRHAQAITCLPSVFQIWILLDGANDRFAPDAHSGGFAVPPEELPTISTVEVCGSSPHGPTIFFNNIGRRHAFRVAPHCSNKSLSRCAGCPNSTQKNPGAVLRDVAR